MLSCASENYPTRKLFVYLVHRSHVKENTLSVHVGTCEIHGVRAFDWGSSESIVRHVPTHTYVLPSDVPYEMSRAGTMACATSIRLHLSPKHVLQSAGMASQRKQKVNSVTHCGQVRFQNLSCGVTTVRDIVGTSRAEMEPEWHPQTLFVVFVKGEVSDACETAYAVYLGCC